MFQPGRKRNKMPNIESELRQIKTLLVIIIVLLLLQLAGFGEMLAGGLAILLIYGVGIGAALFLFLMVLERLVNQKVGDVESSMEDELERVRNGKNEE